MNEDVEIIKNLIRLGALTVNDRAVGGGHFWLHTPQGALDIIPEDLTEEH
jgi:hypothetical protein